MAVEAIDTRLAACTSKLRSHRHQFVLKRGRLRLGIHVARDEDIRRTTDAALRDKEIKISFA